MILLINYILNLPYFRNHICFLTSVSLAPANHTNQKYIMNLPWMAHNLLELAIAYWFLNHTILKLQNVGFYDFGKV